MTVRDDYPRLAVLEQINHDTDRALTPSGSELTRALDEIDNLRAEVARLQHLIAKAAS